LTNEIFGKVADSHPDTLEEIDQRAWQPFYSKFKQGGQDLFDSYFFPYGLILNPNVRKSEVYAELREKWRAMEDPEIIVKELATSQDAFLDLVCGTNLQKHRKELDDAFRSLYRAGTSISTYPFLMKLSDSARLANISTSDATSVVAVVESFLIRRAIVGHEPTGLHSRYRRVERLAWG
jgi:hypothetical protein